MNKLSCVIKHEWLLNLSSFKNGDFSLTASVRRTYKDAKQCLFKLNLQILKWPHFLYLNSSFSFSDAQKMNIKESGLYFCVPSSFFHQLCVTPCGSHRYTRCVSLLRLWWRLNLLQMSALEILHTENLLDYKYVWMTR